MTSDPLARFRLTRAGRLRETERLRPMKSSEILDLSMQVYQRLGTVLLRVTAIPALLCVASLAFIDSYVLPSLSTTTNAQSVLVQTNEFLVTICIALFLAAPVFLIGLVSGTTSVVRLVSDHITGRECDTEGAIRESQRLIPRMIGLVLREMGVALSGLVFGVLLMAFGSWGASGLDSESALPGIAEVVGLLSLVGGIGLFLTITQRHSLAPVAAILEGTGYRASAKRSATLLKTLPFHNSGFGTIGNIQAIVVVCAVAIWASTAGVMQLLNVSQRVQTLLAGTALAPLAQIALGLIAPYLAIWVLLPYWASGLTVAYYERRIRLEGFDIEALASHISTSTQAQARVSMRTDG